MSDEDEAKSNWRKILRDSDKVRQQWIDQLKSTVNEVSTEQKQTNYEPATDKRLDTKTKLVRLDDVIKAMHVMHAEIVLHIMPNEIRKGLIGVRDSLLRGTATWTAVQFIAKEAIAKSVVQFFSSVHSFFSSLQDDADLELAIRDEGEAARRDLVHDNKLKQAKKLGRVRDVRTRHKTPKHKRHFKGCKSL